MEREADMRRESVMKGFAIVVVQVLLAAAVMAMGATLVAGSETMSPRLAGIGLGDTARMTLGAVEMFAGLCLLMPRGQVVAVALLALVTAGAAGTTLAQSAAGGVQFAAAHRAAPQLQTALDGACAGGSATSLKTAAMRDWRI